MWHFCVTNVTSFVKKSPYCFDEAPWLYDDTAEIQPLNTINKFSNTCLKSFLIGYPIVEKCT